MIERLKSEERKARRAGWMDNVAMTVFGDKKHKEVCTSLIYINFDRL